MLENVYFKTVSESKHWEEKVKHQLVFISENAGISVKRGRGKGSKRSESRKGERGRWEEMRKNYPIFTYLAIQCNFLH